MSNFKKFAAIVADQVEEHTSKRMDASQVANLERELTAQAAIIIADFGPLKAEVLAPLNTETPPWAEAVSHPVLTDTGRARVVANGAGDLPLVGIELDDNETPLYTVACAWESNWLEMLAPEEINRLAARRQSAANAVARALDEVGMIGAPSANLGGFLNNPSVPTFTLLTGDWSNPGTSTAQILADLNAWENFLITVGGEVPGLYPNTLALPGSDVAILSRNAGTGTDTSIWDLFVKTSQGVREGHVGQDEWDLVRVPYANNILGNRRGTMYRRAPEVLVTENPLPFDELPPQARNLAMITPCVGRTGGVIWKKPSKGAYATLGAAS